MDFDQETIDAIAAAVMAKLTGGTTPATTPATPATTAPPAVSMDLIRPGMSKEDAAAVRAECLRVLGGGR